MMEAMFNVYRCETCNSNFELPEPEKGEKVTCSSCGSEEIKKLFAFNKGKPSPFS